MRSGRLFGFRLEIQQEFSSASSQPIGPRSGDQVRNGGVRGEMEVLLEILLENHLSDEYFKVVAGGDDLGGRFESLVDDLLRGKTLIRLGGLLESIDDGNGDGCHVDLTGVLRTAVGECFRLSS